MATPAWNAWPSRVGATGFRFEAVVVESQAREGRSGADDLPIIKLETCNEAAFMGERKRSFVKSKAVDGRGSVDDRPIHTPAQPRNETASRKASTRFRGKSGQGWPFWS
jgi:hypothetical protein